MLSKETATSCPAAPAFKLSASTDGVEVAPGDVGDGDDPPHIFKTQPLAKTAAKRRREEAFVIFITALGSSHLA